MTEAISLPCWRVATPPEVAEMIALLASEESSGVSGEAIRVALGSRGASAETDHDERSTHTRYLDLRRARCREYDRLGDLPAAGLARALWQSEPCRLAVECGRHDSDRAHIQPARSSLSTHGRALRLRARVLRRLHGLFGRLGLLDLDPRHERGSRRGARQLSDRVLAGAREQPARRRGESRSGSSGL